ncbi:hypothetical protein DFQ28_010311 [Apophysomyces sp. BC1034]|nr:hypothetical protein DFQ30_010189 [Apophysomyces sp. BC1015]KAG0177557.1 hypothetical protein DFQ29_004692 [Apophysomyces sp. BC1021]KAG0192040.1 hypothetical protein DFQ28_010311 [Apophysomyces sp. BC1034]
MNVTWGYRFFCSDEASFFCDRREFHEVSTESLTEFCKEFKRQLGAERTRHAESYEAFVDYHAPNPQLESLEMTLSQTLVNFSWDNPEPLSKDTSWPIENYVYAITACPRPPDMLMQDHKFRVWTMPTNTQQQLRDKYLERHILINCIDVSDPHDPVGADKEGFKAFFVYFGGQVVPQHFLLAERHQIPFSSIFGRYCPTSVPGNTLLSSSKDSDISKPADHDVPIWFGVLTAGPDIGSPTFSCPVSAHLFLSTNSISRSKEVFKDVTNIHSAVVLHYTQISPAWFAASPNQPTREGTFLLRATNNEKNTFASFLRFLKSHRFVLLCELSSMVNANGRELFQALIDVATPESASVKLLQTAVDIAKLRQSRPGANPCLDNPAAGEIVDFLRIPVLEIPDKDIIKQDWHTNHGDFSIKNIQIEPPQHILNVLAKRRSRKRARDTERSEEAEKGSSQNKREKRNISSAAKRPLSIDGDSSRETAKDATMKKQKTLGELMNEEKAAKVTRSTLEDLPFMKRIVDFKSAPGPPQKEKGYIQAKMDLTKEICGRVMVKAAGPFFKSANDTNTAKRRKPLSPVTIESFLDMVTKEWGGAEGKLDTTQPNPPLLAPSEHQPPTRASPLSPHGRASPKDVLSLSLSRTPLSPPRPSPARLAHLAAGKRDLLPFFEEAISEAEPLPELIPHRFDRIFDEDSSDFKPLVLRIPTDVELYENRHYFE